MRPITSGQGICARGGGKHYIADEGRRRIYKAIRDIVISNHDATVFRCELSGLALTRIRGTINVTFHSGSFSGDESIFETLCDDCPFEVSVCRGWSASTMLSKHS
jgi:hypothetical protein